MSKLEAFLPQMAKENEKLQRDVEAGKENLYNIEAAEEAEEEKPQIEMNFALGLMEDEDDN